MNNTVVVRSATADICTRSLEYVFVSSNPEEMCEALQTIIQLASNGQSIDHLVLPVIKYASASTDHRLKKLLHIFWPLVDCYQGDHLKPHIILISNSILNDLKSPNEMILCSALRCILNLQVVEVIANLVAGIPPLLTHPDPRVRSAAITAIHSVCARYDDIVSFSDIYTRLAEEDDPSVLRRLIFLLTDLDPENGALHVLKLLKRVGIGPVSEFLYLVLPQLVKCMHGDKIGFLETIYTVTKKNLIQFDARIQYSAGLGLWAVVILYPSIYFQNTPCSDEGDTKSAINREDIAVLAIQALLYASRTIDDNCINVTLSVIKEAVSMFTQTFMAHSIISGILFSLCSSHMSDATRLRLINLRLFSTLSQINSPWQLIEAFIISPFIDTTSLTILSNSVSELVTVILRLKSPPDFAGIGVCASLLTELVQRVVVYSPSYTTLTTTDIDYKKDLWITLCCDLIKILLHILKVTEQSHSSSSTVNVSRLCIRLLLLFALGNKGPNNNWTFEISRASIAAIGDVSPTLVVFLVCYLLKVNLTGFSKEHCDTLMLDVLSAVVLELSNDPARLSGTLCALLHAQNYTSQDTALVISACYYLLKGLRDSDATGLCKKEELAGLLLVGLAKFYELSVKSVSISQRDLSLLNEQMKAIIDYVQGRELDEHLRDQLIDKPASNTYSSVHQTSQNSRLHPLSGVHFSICSSELEQPALTPETAILFHSDFKNLYSTRDDAYSPLMHGTTNEVEMPPTSIFTKDTDFSLCASKSLNRISGTVKNVSDSLSSSTLDNIIQLSGDSECIYAEAIVHISSAMVTLDVLFINRSKESAQDVTLELFSTPSLRVPRNENRSVNLEPHGSARTKYILYVDSCDTGIIYGNVYAKFTQEKQRNEPRMHEIIHRTKEIEIPIKSFLSPYPLRDRDFSRLWATFDWEYKIPISTQVPPDGVIRTIKNGLNSFMLPEDELLIQEAKVQSYCCNLSAQSKKGIILMSIIVHSSQVDGLPLTIGVLRLRSKFKTLVESASSYLSLLIFN